MTILFNLIFLLLGAGMGVVVGWLADIVPTYLKAHWQNPEIQWQPFAWPIRLPNFDSFQWRLTVFSALLYLWLYGRFGLTWTLLATLVFSTFLLALAIIDWRHLLLPDCLTLPLLWLGLFFNVFHAFTLASIAVMGAILGYVVLWLLFYLYYFVTDKKALGFGDIKLFAAIGAWIGWPFLPLTLLISAVIGIIIYLLWRQQGKPVAQGIPFGTCLALGGWLSMMFGPHILLLLYQYYG